MNKESLQRYTWSLLASVGLFALSSSYIFLRRGYYTLFIANKALGGVALILIGIILLIGPLSRLYQRFDSFVVFRKALGIVAFIFALVHSVVSFFYLPEKFPLTYFLQDNLAPFLFGLAALLLLIALFILSFRFMEQKINSSLWWQWQYRGIRIAAFFVLLHVVIAKYPGWFKWFSVGGSEELSRPFMPPASLIFGSFWLFVFLVRLGEYLGTRMARRVTLLLFLLLLSFWVGSYARGKTKTPFAPPLQWKTCVKLPGSIIHETFPRICLGPDGRSVTEPLPSEPIGTNMQR